jgi:H+/Cl- antiporter ClcA
MKDVSKWGFKEHYMIIYIVLKFIFTILSLSCSVPAGIFMPTFTMGIVAGQLYCSFLLRILNAMKARDLIMYRGIYSILGASALTASVTRTVSVAVIVLELNGHMGHVVPVLVSVLTAYIISELINPKGFFEMLSELNGLNDKIMQKGRILIKEILKSETKFN